MLSYRPHTCRRKHTTYSRYTSRISPELRLRMDYNFTCILIPTTLNNPSCSWYPKMNGNPCMRNSTAWPRWSRETKAQPQAQIGSNLKMPVKSLEFRQRHGRTTATSVSSHSPKSVAKSTSTALTSTHSSESTESHRENSNSSNGNRLCFTA